jgi:hypothetical protein
VKDVDVSKRDIWRKMNIVRPIFTVPAGFVCLADPPTSTDGDASRNFWISEEFRDACEGDFLE